MINKCGKTVNAENVAGLLVHSFKINENGKHENDFIHICELEEGHEGNHVCSCGVAFPDEEVLNEIQLENLKAKHQTLLRQEMRLKDETIEMEKKLDDKRKEIGVIRDKIQELVEEE